MKDPRTDDLEPPLQILSDRSLLIKQFAQITRHRERASLSILRPPWIESDFAGAEIDLSPFERQDFTTDPPSLAALDKHWKRRVEALPRPNGLARIYSANELDQLVGDLEGAAKQSALPGRGVREEPAQGVKYSWIGDMYAGLLNRLRSSPSAHQSGRMEPCSAGPP